MTLLKQFGTCLGQLEPQEYEAHDAHKCKDPKDCKLANELRERQKEESQEDAEEALDPVHERGTGITHACRKDLGQEWPEERANANLEAGDKDKDDRNREYAGNVVGAPDEEHSSNDVGGRHDCEATENQRSATDAFDQEERPKGRDKVPRSDSDRGDELCIVATETSGFEDAGSKVDDGIDARKLQRYGEHETDQHELGVRGEEQQVGARSLRRQREFSSTT